ncbi:hypothetical protein F511_47683 [Dorcoceras hygrometricum]|uniref:Uncharacterized protein n=1 Tax=Dorcoceras hygrometricum TaxID=472368 RepID=A0A2Z6ZRF0_9LAMI|nr:hypothetical protein F511_47683 [Dorcoceras hygrometricum]
MRRRAGREWSRDEEARWPHFSRLLPPLVEARWTLLVDDCAALDGRWARCCVALGVVRYALPPRFLRGGGAAVAGRRSGASPAMS